MAGDRRGPEPSQTRTTPIYLYSPLEIAKDESIAAEERGSALQQAATNPIAIPKLNLCIQIEKLLFAHFPVAVAVGAVKYLVELFARRYCRCLRRTIHGGASEQLLDERSERLATDLCRNFRHSPAGPLLCEGHPEELFRLRSLTFGEG